MVVKENNSRRLWLEEWEIDRKLKLGDEKESLESSASEIVDVEVSPYTDASTLKQGDIVVVSRKQCEASWPMHFAVWHNMPGEIILIPFNNFSTPAASMEVKMYNDKFPFTRVLCINAMFTADPSRLKCWSSGKMGEMDILLMKEFIRHQHAGRELSEEAKSRQGAFAFDWKGSDIPPKEFIEYQNELHILVNKLALQVAVL